jgi:hypothetical protein
LTYLQRAPENGGGTGVAGGEVQTMIRTMRLGIRLCICILIVVGSTCVPFLNA